MKTTPTRAHESTNGPRLHIAALLALALAAGALAACSDSDDGSSPGDVIADGDVPPNDDVLDTDGPADDVAPSDGDGSGTEETVPDTAPDDVETRIATVATDFLNTVDGFAAAPVPAPELVLETTPDLAFYARSDDEQGVVVLSRWDELDAEARSLFEGWAGTTGGAYDGRGLFEELFNWFFVVHELGHHLQAESEAASPVPEDSFSFWDSELQANEIAVAHFDALDRARLDALVVAMRQVLDSLDVPEGAGDRDFFDREYESLGEPSVYGYFQFSFVLDAYERIDELDLATIVRDDLGL